MFGDFINVIGVGQCGTRLGGEFEKMGVNVSYINSDEADVRGLSNKKNNMLLLDTRGTGASPTKGREMVQKHKKDFDAFLEKHASKDKINLVIAGAGGGTGGGIVAPILEALHYRGYKAGCLLTLPPKMLNLLAADNALKTLKEVKSIPLNMFIIADNEHLLEQAEVGSDWWKQVNQEIVHTVLSPFGILDNNKQTRTGFGSIDKGEINRIMQFGQGLTDIRAVTFSAKEIKDFDDADIKDRLFSSSLVSGYEYKYSLAYMISIDVPEKGDSNEFAKRILTIAQKVSGSAVVRVGMFTDPKLKDSVRVVAVNCGLKFPKVLNSRVKNLKRDSDRYKDKMAKADSVDLSIGDSVISDNFDL